MRKLLYKHIYWHSFVWRFQNGRKITTPFCSFIHFIWLTHNISFTRELCAHSSLLGFPCNVFVHNSLVVVQTHHQLNFFQSDVRVQVSFHNGKKDLVSQGSVSGIMPSYWALRWTWTFIEWLTSWTVSSLSHNEEIVRGADMAWKLCDQRGVPKIQVAVCSEWKMSWCTGK